MKPEELPKIVPENFALTCGRCGNTLGDHMDYTCPDGTRNGFTLLPKIWVAVVGDFQAHLGWSKRSYGDWASFIGTDRTEVIQRAMGAKRAWKSAGSYKVYLGTITEEESVQGWKVVEPIPEPPPPPKRMPGNRVAQARN